MESEADDNELIAKIRGGAVHFFSALVEKHQQRIFAVVYSMLRNRQDAEDVAQEVFLTAFRKLDSFEARASFLTWLRRIAYHSCIDHHRRNKSRKREQLFSIQEVEGPSLENEPVSNVIADETISTVRLAIDRLPNEHRAILVLRDMEGLDYAEIASVLEIPIGTVRSRLHRARTELKQSLISNGFEASDSERQGN